MESYRRNLEMHVYPVLGGKPINEIQRKQAKAFLDGLSISGLTRATIAVIKASINGVLTYALDCELIESKPLKDLTGC